MYKIIFFLFISVFQFLNAQDLKFHVVDEISGLKIEFVSINLLNGKGFYGDKNGMVEYNFDGIDEIELSHISYFTKKIKVNSIGADVYLKPKDFSLNEVIIQNNKEKVYKELKLEHQKSDSFFGFGTYGIQAITKLENPTNKNIYLEEVYIPVQYDEMYMQVNKQSKISNVIVKIDFYEVNDTLAEFPITESNYAVITNKQIKKGIATIKLKNSIKMDTTGIRFAVTFIGKADDNGNLIFENPNYFSTFQGKSIKMTKYIPIQIPLLIEKNTLKTFTRSVFSENQRWIRIVPPISTPFSDSEEERMKKYEEKMNQYPNFTFNLGFKYYFYE